MINPYNFVRSGRSVSMETPAGHDRISGLHGTLTCRLETVTPIFTPAFAHRPVGAPADLRFFRVGERPALPGASLKGMLRSTAEAIADGCSPFDSRQHPRCRSKDNLCPCCRLFGYLKGEQVHAGQVCISDALAEEDWEMGPRITLKELSSPKPERHDPFYPRASAREVNPFGRKFYYHQQHVKTASDIPTESRPTQRNVRIEPLLKGTFDFTVRFWNTREDELGLLLYALELPSGLHHKIGMAKPLGLGSIRIDIMGWQEAFPDPANPASRYRGIAAEVSEVSLKGLEGTALEEARRAIHDRIDRYKTAYAQAYCRAIGVTPVNDLWSLSEPNLQDLRILLSLVGYSTEIRYPGYGWFQQDRQSGSIPLPSVQEVHRGARLPDPHP